MALRPFFSEGLPIIYFFDNIRTKVHNSFIKLRLLTNFKNKVGLDSDGFLTPSANVKSLPAKSLEGLSYYGAPGRNRTCAPGSGDRCSIP